MDDIKSLIEKQKSWLIIIVLGIITLAPLFMADIDKNPKLWYLVGWLFWVIKLSIDKIDSLNLAWHRLWLQLTNGSVYWTISAELDGQIENDTLDKVYEKIVSKFPSITRWPSREGEVVLKLPVGGVVRLNISTYQHEVDQLKSTLYMEVSDFAVPFRDSEKILDDLISIIDYAIKPVLSPQKEKYVFRVRFGDSNPYFGLFIKRFKTPDHNLISFRVEFDEKVGLSQERIDVSASRLSLTTYSVNSLQKLSRKYITLSNFHSD